DLLLGMRLKPVPLLYAPGTNWNYDNINFIVLAMIIEKITGKSYPDYIRKYILEPAGMQQTFLPHSSFYHYTPEEKKSIAETYRLPLWQSTALEKTDTIQFVADYWKVYNFSGFGEIVSTAGDLLKYDQALYSGRLVN